MNSFKYLVVATMLIASSTTFASNNAPFSKINKPCSVARTSEPLIGCWQATDGTILKVYDDYTWEMTFNSGNVSEGEWNAETQRYNFYIDNVSFIGEYDGHCYLTVLDRRFFKIADIDVEEDEDE